MTYSGGSFAISAGINWRKMASACLRANATAAWSDAGRIGNNSDTLCSSARIAEASRMKALARLRGFSCAVARYAWIAMRINTSSALGFGKSSVPVRPRSCTHHRTTMQPCGEAMAYRRTVNGWSA